MWLNIKMWIVVEKVEYLVLNLMYYFRVKYECLDNVYILLIWDLYFFYIKIVILLIFKSVFYD